MSRFNFARDFSCKIPGYRVTLIPDEEPMFLDELEQIDNLRRGRRRRLEKSIESEEDNLDRANPNPIVPSDSIEEYASTYDRKTILNRRKNKTAIEQRRRTIIDKERR